MDTSKTDKQIIDDLSKAFADNLTDEQKTKANSGGHSVACLMALDTNTMKIGLQQNLGASIMGQFFEELRIESLKKINSNKSGKALMNEKLDIAKDIGCFEGNTPSALRDIRSAISWMECDSPEKHKKEKSPEVKLAKSVSKFKTWKELRKAYDTRPREMSKAKKEKEALAKDSEIVNLDKLYAEFKKGLLSVTKTEKAKRIKSISQAFAEFNLGGKNTVATATPKDKKRVANQK